MSRFALSDLPPKYAAQAQAQIYAKLPVSEGVDAKPGEKWTLSLAALPAKSPAKAAASAVRGKPAKRRNDESLSQQALIKWWSVACHEFRLPEEVLIGLPLQGVRTARNGARMKAEGNRRGLPDLLVAVPRGDCCSLWIEMKSPVGYLRPEQKKMLAMLTEHGAATVVCRSTGEAIKAITGYILMDRKTEITG